LASQQVTCGQARKVNSYEIKRFVKIILLLLAVFIGGITLFFSQRLSQKVAQEEKKKVQTWAKAMKMLSDPEVEGDLSFYLELVKDNTTIPAIVVNESGNITQFINLDSSRVQSKDYLKDKLSEFKNTNEAISIPIDKGVVHTVYYGESSVLRQLRYYPFVVLGVVALFVLVSYFAFSVSRRSEQNQVWVGLAKETAHQLGTPISSLMGWVDVIEMGEMPENATDEMRKDITRLQIITERFSKIGSEPILRKTELNEALNNSVKYMQMRSGSEVLFKINESSSPVQVNLNLNLFDWVIENLTKNSIDAMEGKGFLEYTVTNRNGKVYIDISDTGRGIPRNRFKTIFKPGYTTKKRGWGLGLSLARRIIQDYHQGEIFVKESQPNVRTTFRIVLSEASSATK
jgi:signal transduction histidine kinase